MAVFDYRLLNADFLPPLTLQLFDGVDALLVGQLEADSRYEWKPVTLPTDRGGALTEGFRFEGQFYTVNNDPQLVRKLQSFSGKAVVGYVELNNVNNKSVPHRVRFYQFTSQTPLWVTVAVEGLNWRERVRIELVAYTIDLNSVLYEAQQVPQNWWESL